LIFIRGETMVEKKTWKEFQEAGMLWWINMILHTFGWAICVAISKDEIVDVFPARVKFRGFNEEYNTKGYVKVSKYLEANIEDLREEAES